MKKTIIKNVGVFIAAFCLFVVTVQALAAGPSCKGILGNSLLPSNEEIKVNINQVSFELRKGFKIEDTKFDPTVIHDLLLQFKNQVEESKNKLLISKFNTLVIDAIFSKNVDDKKIGYTAKPTVQSVLPIQRTLHFFIDSGKTDQYSSLLKEFSLRLWRDQRNFDIYAKVQSRDQFEVSLLIVELMSRFNTNKKSLLEYALTVQNSFAKEAAKFLLSLELVNLPFELYDVAVGIKSEFQLEAFTEAAVRQINNRRFYMEILPKIKDEDDLDKALTQIKTLEF